jgi:carbon storage regulator
MRTEVQPTWLTSKILKQGGFKMLVLSRKKGEQIVIGEDVIVTVLEVAHDRVKLGFRGPADVPIHRQEVFDRVREASTSL